MSERSKYSLLGRINFEDLYNAFLGLEQRQQTFIAIGGVVLALLIIFVPISCAGSKLGKLQKDYEESQEGMATFMSKIHDYQVSRERLSEIQKQLSAGGGQSLTTVLETLANEEGIGGNIEKLRPINMGTTDYFDETGVDAAIGKVSLEQAVSYLHRIETHPDIPMKIKKLQIKPRYGGRSQMTLTFQVSTIQIRKEASDSE